MKGKTVKDIAKIILGIKDATDAEMLEADNTFIVAVKDFIAAKPKRKQGGWNQAINARFMLEGWVEDGEIYSWSDFSPIERAVACYWLANASQLRQRLEKAGIVEASAIEDY